MLLVMAVMENEGEVGGRGRCCESERSLDRYLSQDDEAVPPS